MTLLDGEKNGIYLVKEMNVEQSVYSMRLKSIGVKDGSYIKVINKKAKGGVIIQIDKKQIALCKNMASGIIVEFEKKEFSEAL